jgi:hypothetical protein
LQPVVNIGGEAGFKVTSFAIVHIRYPPLRTLFPALLAGFLHGRPRPHLSLPAVLRDSIDLKSR